MPKGCLRLEVTESLIMENPEQSIEILDWLKSLGAGIALDEFGAGYSSLSYLHRLAVDTIKIDRSLISNDTDNKAGAVVLRAALAMARELGKDVVAVGMEKEDDVAYVRALGCDYAQGFFFGEPMTEREVMNLLNALAKSNKRDEKREKKKRKLESEVADVPPELEVARLPRPAAEPAPIQSGSQILPVPIPKPAMNKLRKRKSGGGLFSSLKKGLGHASAISSKAASFGGSLKGALTPLAAKNPKRKPGAPGAKPAQGLPPVPQREPQSLHARLPQVDPLAGEGPYEQPAPPQYGHPHAPQTGPGVAPDPEGDYRQDEIVRERRRRVSKPV